MRESDNYIINQSMLNGNYDWMLILIVVSVCVIAFISHLNRRRWVMQGGRRVCGHCMKQYTAKAKQMQINIGEIVRTPAQDDLPCCDCNRGVK